MAAPSPSLIYCGDGNPAHARIAVAAGWLYGVRLPARGMLYDVPLVLADQDWRKPDRTAYMAALAKHCPTLATVLDLEREEQLPEVLSWMEEAAQHVTEAVIVIPKVSGAVPLLPCKIGGKEVRLGYSVPTSHGASPLGLWEFMGRTVHMLGGLPQKQFVAWQYLHGIADVRSLDCNAHKRLATMRLYWERQLDGRVKHLAMADGIEGGVDRCFKASCENIKRAWEFWQKPVSAM